MNEEEISSREEIIFLGIVALFWFAQYVYIPYQTTYLSGCGVSSNFIGMIIGAYGVSQMLLRFPVGILADCIGKHKKFIMIGCLSSGIASFFRMIYCNGEGFFLANFFSGFASAMWISFMVFYTQYFKEEEQQKATGKIIMFNNIGMLTGFILSIICYKNIGMKGICLLSCVGGMVAFFLTFFIKESKERKKTVKIEELLKICKGKRILIFSFLALIQQGIQLTTVMSFTTQILKNKGASDITVGISSVVYMLSAVLFSAISGSKFCRKRGTKFWIPFIFILVAVYNILVPVINDIYIILILQLLPGMSTGILFSYTISEAMIGIPKEKKSTAMGFFQAIFAFGMTIFPIITGKIVSISDMKIGYFFLAGIALIGSLISWKYYEK